MCGKFEGVCGGLSGCVRGSSRVHVWGFEGVCRRGGGVFVGGWSLLVGGGEGVWCVWGRGVYSMCMAVSLVRSYMNFKGKHTSA